MKYTQSLLAAALLLCGAQATFAQSSGQGWPTTQVLLTTSTSTIAATSTNAACTSQAFTANALTGFAVFPSLSLASSTAAATTVTLNFAPAITGTLAGVSGATGYTSTTPLSVTTTVSGTTPTLDYIDVPPNSSGSGVANAPYWYLKSVTNSGASALTINSITISTSNR